MNLSFINAHQLPLIIEPDSTEKSKEALLLWIRNNEASFREQFHKYGAVLFRGFDIDTPKDFEDVALLVDPNLKKDYYGTSPRNPVPGTEFVYTASELPKHYPIMQHCEMSFMQHPPVSIFFYCNVAPDYGGESPLCNFRKVYQELNPKIKNELEQKGLLTVRNYSSLENNSRFNLFELKKWNDIFHTTEKAEVEKQCKEQSIDWEWLPNGNLRLIHKNNAFVQHPVTKEPVWFNHIQVFHPAAAAIEYKYIHAHQQRTKTWLLKTFLNTIVKWKNAGTKPIDQSLNVLFGDGTAIPDSYVEHLEEIIWKNLVIIPWQKNDVIAVDNLSTSHGRLPFEGNRSVLVSWSH